MILPAFLVLIFSLGAPARAAEPIKPEVKASSAAGNSSSAAAVNKFVAMVLEEGMSESFPPALSAAYQLPEGLDGRILQVFPEDAADGLLHAFNALVEDAEPTVVRRLILLTRKQPPDGKTTEFYAFICSPDGTLLKAVRSAWRNDSGGEAMETPGAHKLLDLAAPATRARFRRELDFWIKGRYRKK